MSKHFLQLLGKQNTTKLNQDEMAAKKLFKVIVTKDVPSSLTKDVPSSSSSLLTKDPLWRF